MERMKQFLFVFLVLGWTAAAYAQTDVFVFDMKMSNTGFKYIADENTWAQIKDSNTAFLIVELPEDGNTAKIHAVYTWKGKDKKNYAMDVNMGRAFAGSATIGSTEISLVADVNTNTPTQTRTQLSGNNKLVTIGKKTNKSCLGCHTAGELTILGNLDVNCPPSLTGYQIKIKTYADGNKKLFTSTLSVKLDIAKTLAIHPNVVTAEDEANTLLSQLYDAGYTVVEP
jgi:hypothetical protein